MLVNLRKYPIDLRDTTSTVDLRRNNNRTIPLCNSTMTTDIKTGIVSQVLFLKTRDRGLVLDSHKPSGAVYLEFILADIGELVASGSNPTITKGIYLTSTGELTLYGSVTPTVDKVLSIDDIGELELSSGAEAVVAIYRTVGEMDDIAIENFDRMALGDVDVIIKT